VVACKGMSLMLERPQSASGSGVRMIRRLYTLSGQSRLGKVGLSYVSPDPAAATSRIGG